MVISLICIVHLKKCHTTRHCTLHSAQKCMEYMDMLTALSSAQVSTMNSNREQINEKGLGLSINFRQYLPYIHLW
jgi:hypothetical protein